MELMWETTGAVATDSDERADIIASVRRQAPDAGIEAAVRAAVAAFPTDVQISLTTFGDLVDGTGSLSIAITGSRP
jgi:hypothetical protein